MKNKNELIIYPTCQSPKVGETGVIKDGFFIPNQEMPCFITSCWRMGTVLYVSSTNQNVSYIWRNIAGLNKFGECLEVISSQTTTENFLDVGELITTPNVKYYVADVEMLYNGSNFYNVIYRCNFSTEEIYRIGKDRYKVPSYENYYLGKFFEKKAIFKMDKSRKEYISGNVGSKSTVASFVNGADNSKDDAVQFSGRGRIRYENIDIFGRSGDFALCFWAKIDSVPEDEEYRTIFCESGRTLEDNSPLIECYITRESTQSEGRFKLCFKFINYMQTEFSEYYIELREGDYNLNIGNDQWNFFFFYIEDLYYIYYNINCYNNGSFNSMNYQARYYSSYWRFLWDSDNVFVIGNNLEGTRPWRGTLDELYIWQDLFFPGQNYSDVYRTWVQTIYNSGNPIFYKDKYSIVFPNIEQENFLEIINYRNKHSLLKNNGEFIKVEGELPDSMFAKTTKTSTSWEGRGYFLVGDKLYFVYNNYSQLLEPKKKWKKISTSVSYSDNPESYAPHCTLGVTNDGYLYRINGTKLTLVNEWNNWEDISTSGTYISDYYNSNDAPNSRKYGIWGIAGGKLYFISYDGNGYDNENNVFNFNIAEASEKEGWTAAPVKDFNEYYNYVYAGVCNKKLVYFYDSTEEEMDFGIEWKRVYSYTGYSSDYAYFILALSMDDELYAINFYKQTCVKVFSGSIDQLGSFDSYPYFYSSYNTVYYFISDGYIHCFYMRKTSPYELKTVCLTGLGNGWTEICGFNYNNNEYYRAFGVKNGELYSMVANGDSLENQTPTIITKKIGISNTWKRLIGLQNHVIGIRGI